MLAEDRQLHVEVAVRADDAQSFTAMGRQAIHPVPAAVWAAPRNHSVHQFRATTATLGTVEAVAVTTGTLEADALTTGTANVTGVLPTADANIQATTVATRTLTATEARVAGPATATYFEATGPSPKLTSVFTIEEDLQVNEGAADGLYHPRAFANRLCFLTRDYQNDGGNWGDEGYCRVTHHGADWFIVSASRGDLSLSCSMRCISW